MFSLNPLKCEAPRDIIHNIPLHSWLPVPMLQIMVYLGAFWMDRQLGCMSYLKNIFPKCGGTQI